MTPFMPTVTLSPDALVRIEGGEVITWAECERRLLAARTPAPEGEAVKSYGQKGRALYEAFWARNGDASPPPWDEQAHAIRAMWVNIARDAEPLYASPVVPVGVSERMDEVKSWAESSECSRGCSSWRPDVHGRSRCDCGREDALEAADAILAALRPTDTGRE